MSEFQIIDEKRYPLNVKSYDMQSDLLPYFRWEHRVTLGRNAKEFMVFVDTLYNSVYIEEIIQGRLEIINDDSLHSSLVNFAHEKEFLGIFSPILKPSSQRPI